MTLGPRPAGDPDGMLRAAARIRSAHGSLAGLPSIRFDDWQSRRAEQARATIERNVRSMHRVEDQLRHAAWVLESEAHDLKVAQRKWDESKAAEQTLLKVFGELGELLKKQK